MEALRVKVKGRNSSANKSVNKSIIVRKIKSHQLKVNQQAIANQTAEKVSLVNEYNSII